MGTNMLPGTWLSEPSASFTDSEPMPSSRPSLSSSAAPLQFTVAGAV